MPKILIERDHFLDMLAVILDPEVADAHASAVCAFFAHDVPDFPGWCAALRARLPGLAPAGTVMVRDQDELAAEIADADAVVVESLVIDDRTLAPARRLALVQKFGTLASNIDRAACARHGVEVAILRRRVNVAVAEQAFALLVALAKRIPELNGLVEARPLAARGFAVRPRSPHAGYSNFAGIPGLRTLADARIGIVGLGEVGREVARRAAALEMDIVYHQRRRLPATDEQELGARYLSLAELMAQSDYVVVQLPLNEQTRGIIGRDLIALMRPGAMLINVARAELIDRDAVVAALASGRLGGFGLDVGYAEPADPADPLLGLRGRNVILMPHTAIGARDNALADLEALCRNLWRAVVRQERNF